MKVPTKAVARAASKGAAQLKQKVAGELYQWVGKTWPTAQDTVIQSIRVGKVSKGVATVSGRFSSTDYNQMATWSFKGTFDKVTNKLKAVFKTLGAGNLDM